MKRTRQLTRRQALRGASAAGAGVVAAGALEPSPAAGASFAALTPTPVKASAYKASAGQFVPVNASARSVTITLPRNPVDGAQVAIKIVAITPPHVVNVVCSGLDVLNRQGGLKVMTLVGLNQGVLLQYQARTSIWYEQAGALALAVPRGAAKLGTDGTVGGPSGSPLSAAAVEQIGDTRYVQQDGTGLPSSVVSGRTLNSSGYGVGGGYWADDGHGNMAIGTCLPAGIDYVGSTQTLPNGSHNTALGNSNDVNNRGQDANLSQNTTGTCNTAIGWGALPQNTTGSFNTAVGEGALYLNTTGTCNAALGVNALRNQTTSHNNTAVGAEALGQGVPQSDNTAIGKRALVNSNGRQNTVIGSQAAQLLTSGNGVVAIGYAALQAATSVSNSVAVGFGALYTTITGDFNTAVGHRALYKARGSECTAVGYNALTANTTGPYNTVIGAHAGDAFTTGQQNTAVGWTALHSIVTGSKNSALGINAGATDGTTATTDVTSATLIGERAQSQLSNVIVLGKAVATRPNLCFGAVPSGSDFFGNGVGVFFIANDVTDPTADPTDGGILYVSAGALKYRGSSGTVTTIANA